MARINDSQYSVEESLLLQKNEGLKDLHVGHRCFILGTGSSIAQQDLKKLKGEIVISVSNFFVHPDMPLIRPKYHVLPPVLTSHGHLSSVSKYLEWFAEMEAKTFDAEMFFHIGDRAELIRSGLFYNRQVHWVDYDHPWDENPITALDLSIIPSVWSVSETAISVAVYMGFSEIYLLGLDHDWFNGPLVHFYKDKEENSEMVTFADSEYQMRRHAYIFKKYKCLYAIKKNIYNANANPNSYVDVFPKVDYDSLFLNNDRLDNLKINSESTDGQFKKPTIEEQILEYALNENNYDNFAELLCRILPAYTKCSRSVDSVSRRNFFKWQESGINLLPNHFYSPIPDMGNISHAYGKINEMIGLNMNMSEQIEFIDTICVKFYGEYIRFPNSKTQIPSQFHFNNGAFERVDAEVLHCIVRANKPKRIIEIGSGYSTLITAAACELNLHQDGAQCQFDAIEPYPNHLFTNTIPGLSRIINMPLQHVEIRFFEDLSAGDILFIDSSHILKPGSDVQMLYLDIIPRIQPGVFIHIHDIFLPIEYPLTWLIDEHIFWNEQYLLQAILALGDSFEIIWSGCNMHLNHSYKLRAAFPGYSPETCLPGSFWIKKVK